jgi:hypothetical protein
MISIGGTLQQIFFIPLIVASVSGVTSSLVMLKVKEEKNGEKLSLRKNLTSDVFNIIAYARKTPNFVKYCYVVGTFEFFMSFAWPLFSIAQITILHATMLQIALLSVV